MLYHKIDVEKFVGLAQKHPVLDVRSEGEFAHAHIPKAISLPLFSDDERKVVGTAYKQQSRELAIKIGLDFFGPKMRRMVEEVEGVCSQFYSAKEASNLESKTVLVHCWRGGMRSGAVAWLLGLYGFEVHTLSGGYKAFRNWVLRKYNHSYPLKVLGGYTGSGKTILLQQLQEKGECILDLEALATHKGSAFGALDSPQPSQEMFENMLATHLSKICTLNGNNLEGKFIWVEDESQRIGNITIPKPFWENMRESQVFFIDIPFKERLDYICQEYGSLGRLSLHDSILRINKRLGPLETKNALAFLANDNLKECFEILLRYYDKWYRKGLDKRNGNNILALPLDKVRDENNVHHLLNTISAKPKVDQ